MAIDGFRGGKFVNSLCRPSHCCPCVSQSRQDSKRRCLVPLVSWRVSPEFWWRAWYQGPHSAPYGLDGKLDHLRRLVGAWLVGVPLPPSKEARLHGEGPPCGHLNDGVTRILHTGVGCWVLDRIEANAVVLPTDCARVRPNCCPGRGVAVSTDATRGLAFKPLADMLR